MRYADVGRNMIIVKVLRVQNIRSNTTRALILKTLTKSLLDFITSHDTLVIG